MSAIRLQKTLTCVAISTAKPLLMLYGGFVEVGRVVKRCFYYCDQLSGQKGKEGNMHKARKHAIYELPQHQCIKTAGFITSLSFYSERIKRCHSLMKEAGGAVLPPSHHLLHFSVTHFQINLHTLTDIKISTTGRRRRSHRVSPQGLFLIISLVCRDH